MNTEVDYCAIDIGTDRCRASVFVNGESTPVPCDAEHSYIPSLLSYSSDCYYVGTQGIQQGHKNPLSNVYQVKKYIGTVLTPGSKEFKYSDYSYYLYSDKKGNPLYCIKKGDTFSYVTIEDALVALISTLKQRIYVFLKRDSIRRVLLTIPPYYSDTQISILTAAASKAGFEEVKVMAEPLATYYGFLKVDMQIPQYLMVCNCGGGQFYCSLLHIVQEVPSIVHTATNKGADGSIITQTIMSLLMKMEEVKEIVSRDVQKYCLLYNMIEKLKIGLSEAQSVSLDLTVLGSETEDDCELSRDVFSQSIAAVITATIQMCKECVHSHLPNADRLPILLVGGCSQIPAIRQAIRTSFPSALFPVVNFVDTVTVVGACSQAFRILSVKKIPLSSLTSKPIGTSVPKAAAETSQQPVVQSTTLVQSTAQHPKEEQPVSQLQIDDRQKALKALNFHIYSYLTYLQGHKEIESSVDWLMKAKLAVEATTYDQWTMEKLEDYENQLARWFQSVKMQLLKS